MRSVWSLWTKPLRAGRRSWMTELHHLLSWVLSVETAKQHYPHTSLFTDDKGAEMLIDGIGLEFERISTALNALDNCNADWWAFGKIYTYRLQSEPFVHIDNDAFLWNSLPATLISADVFAQSPDYFTYRYSLGYQPEKFEFAIHRVKGWIPEELDNYIPVGGIHKAACCGIFGGNHIDFIQYYADLSIRLMEHQRNQAAWLLMDDTSFMCLIFEQYLLEVCVNYHKNKEGSPFQGLCLKYLFESHDHAVRNAEQVGYTHMLAMTKRNMTLLNRLEERVKRDYPEYYQRCLQYINA
jgi:hypothetical protein